MAGIYIELSDELAAKAAQRGLMTNEVFERALRRELTAADTAPVNPNNDSGRYMEGYELGARWAKDAPFGEIAELALWSEQPWRQFSLDPSDHSLPFALCRAQGLEEPSGTDFWLERTPFNEGLVDAVGELWRTASA